MLITPDPDPAFCLVTFNWSEPTGPPVDDVLVRLIAMTDHAQDDGQLEPFLLDRQPDGGWSGTLRLPADLRTSYQLCPVRRGSLREGPIDDARWTAVMAAGLADPANPAVLPAGCTYGNQGPASILELPAAPNQPGWQSRPGTPKGRVTRHTLGSSSVHVYQAPGVEVDAPLVVLFDGVQWLSLDVTTMLDNLVADGLLEPLVVVLVDSIGGARRYHGLTRPRLFRALMDDLVPFVEDGWKVTRDPAKTVASGQSLGGLLATHLARTRPERFGAVLGQSCSFWWPGTEEDGELSGEAEIEAVATGPQTRFHLTAGLHERDLLTSNRRMRDALSAHDLTYREYQGGHDYACWREDLAEGLLTLLPNPTRPTCASA
jgi:enterochelin esterase family protein